MYRVIAGPPCIIKSGTVIPYNQTVRFVTLVRVPIEMRLEEEQKAYIRGLCRIGEAACGIWLNTYNDKHD